MKDKRHLLLFVLLLTAVSCMSTRNDTIIIDNIYKQYDYMINEATKNNANPRTVLPDGRTAWSKNKFDWTMGFFPGSCWLLYEMSGDSKWMNAAKKQQELFVNMTSHSNHDLGFVFNCSYGNAFRITGDSTYLKVLLKAGRTLMDRYNAKVGCIKSWNTEYGWQAKRGWEFPVIIDNLMNLEMLFNLTYLTNDSSYYHVAVSHAETTMRNHFRNDFSSYHVVDYDAETGKVRSKETAQGYSNESNWARGQAWGVYGYTMCYRYTHRKDFLKMAQNIAELIMKEETTPSDKIPYWDNRDPKIPYAYRDVSAAAITASALYELSEYSKEKSRLYKEYADEIMNSLKTKQYTAHVGENNYFILKHSVGSIPHNAEIDVPLNYADYYYIEALKRKDVTLSKSEKQNVSSDNKKN